MKKAFTLSEVLITLGIIGVVAAIILPSVIEKHQKKVTVTRLKKAYTTLSQMLISSYADNGPVELSASVTAEEIEKFFNTYWLPYFSAPKAAKDGESLYDTVYPYYYLNKTKFVGGVYTNYQLGRISFSTQDGIFYYVSVMYWGVNDENGVSDPRYSTEQVIIVDINGKKPPNTLGKDVFRFVINFDKNVVKPYGYNFSNYGINRECSKTGIGQYCAAKIMRDGWKISDDYPW